MYFNGKCKLIIFAHKYSEYESFLTIIICTHTYLQIYVNSIVIKSDYCTKVLSVAVTVLPRFKTPVNLEKIVITWRARPTV